MRFRRLVAAVSAALVSLPMLAGPAGALPAGVTRGPVAGGVEEYRLPNGLKVLLAPNTAAPVATFMVVVHVGSRNEAVGYTGSTHLLEHMMFKGTPSHNKAHGTQYAAEMEKLGADFNATTSDDRTNYFETVPSDRLDDAIAIEADRLRHSFIADADRRSEMTVVRNELERGENSPPRVLYQSMVSAAFREHPYHAPTIGWRTDVEGVPTSRLKTFYDVFYQPNNATAIVVGDFDRERTLATIVKRFGSIPAAPPVPEVYTAEPPQQGLRRVEIHRAGGVPLVDFGWHVPAALGQTGVLTNAQLAARAAHPEAAKETYALEVLQNVLGVGQTSRLYRALVEKQLAIGVNANNATQRDPGLFVVSATGRPGVDTATIESAVHETIAAVAQTGITPEELKRAQAKSIADIAFSRDGTFRVASQLAEYEAIADWRMYVGFPAAIAAVTAADVQRVAAAYLARDNETIATFVPTNPTPGAPAPAAAKPGAYDAAGIKAAPGETAPGGGAAARTRVSFASQTTRIALPNGLVALDVRNTGSDTFALTGIVRAGSAFDPADKPGLADLTATMLNRGTTKRTKAAINATLEDVGASLTFSGSPSAPAADPIRARVRGAGLVKDLPTVLAVLAEEFRTPAFSADELERAKTERIGGLGQVAQSTSIRAATTFLRALFPPGSPLYAPDTDRLIAATQAITLDDIKAFYAAHYVPANLVLGISGNVAAADVRAAIEREFGSDTRTAAAAPLPAAQPVAAYAAQRIAVPMKDQANVDIVFGLPAALNRKSPDYLPAMVANGVLGDSPLSSLLGLQVRDREGLTYDVGSGFVVDSPIAGAVWGVRLSVNPQNIDRGIASTLRVIANFRRTGMTAHELADEKSSLIGQSRVALATNAGIANRLALEEYFGLGLDYTDRYAAAVNAVTLPAANAAIKTYFDPARLTIVSAGDVRATGGAAK